MPDDDNPLNHNHLDLCSHLKEILLNLYYTTKRLNLTLCFLLLLDQISKDSY